ncbi:MAG: hypothetical protein HC911_11370 [Chloroflexaceae bacterium]|nr:hypothetical protein [Chloroflexaceae bacterium]
MQIAEHNHTLAIYLIPSADTSFYQLARAVIGYDVLRGTPVPTLLTQHDPAAAAWVGIARLFGCHATMGEAVAYAAADLDEIATRLDWIASRTAPITLHAGRWYASFALLPRALGITFDDPAEATLRLHRHVVTLVQVLHTASPFFGPHRATFSAADQAAFTRYGTPRYRILENFTLHFSLLSSLPDWSTRQRVTQLLREEYGLWSTPAQRSLHLDTLYLLEQSPDQHFRVVQSFALRGNA